MVSDDLKIRAQEVCLPENSYECYRDYIQTAYSDFSDFITLFPIMYDL